MQDVEIIGMLKSYVSSTLSGMGALKGASCQIQSITDSGTTHTIVFEWEDNNGTSHTSTLEFDSTDELSKLTDITVTDLEDGQVLAYDSTTQKWVNTTNSATVQSIDNIGDVTITSIADGQFLKWDNTAQKWVNGDISFNELENTPTTIAGYGITDAYSKTEVDSALSNKADSATTLSGYGITDAYTKTETDTLLADKAASATTLSGYGITDAYTKTETDTLLSAKADSATTLSGYGITDAYTKTETDSAITTAIEALDVTDSATAGSYVTTVSETDGKIAVTKEAADVSPTSSSTKMVTSGGVYTDTQNVYKANGVLGAKNLLPIDSKYLRTNNTTGTWTGNVYTFTDLTATFNSDNTVTVSGTSNSLFSIDLGELTGLGDVILSGCPSGGSVNTYYLQFYNKTDSQWAQSDYGSGSRVTLDPSKTYGVHLVVRGSVTVSPAIIFKPMIRLASDTDSTYQPYAMTNQQLTSTTNALDTGLTNEVTTRATLGAHNLLPLTLANLQSASTGGTWSDNVYTFNGITYTVNLDDNDNVESILVDGTSTSVSAITVGEIELDNGTYYINGTPSGASVAGYSTLIQVYNGSSWTDVYCLSQNAFTVTNRKIRAYVARIASGTTVSGAYYYPMIRLITDSDTTYTPYAMTNLNITEAIESGELISDSQWTQLQTLFS